MDIIKNRKSLNNTEWKKKKKKVLCSIYGGRMLDSLKKKTKQKMSKKTPPNPKGLTEKAKHILKAHKSQFPSMLLSYF